MDKYVNESELVRGSVGVPGGGVQSVFQARGAPFQVGGLGQIACPFGASISTEDFQVSQVAVRKQWDCGHKGLSSGPGPRVLAIVVFIHVDFIATVTCPEPGTVQRTSAHLIPPRISTRAHRPHFCRFSKLGYCLD